MLFHGRSADLTLLLVDIVRAVIGSSKKETSQLTSRIPHEVDA